MINSRNRRGESPLHLAALYANIRCVRALLRQAASVTSVNVLGQTALHYAVMAGNEKVCSLLLDGGADPNKLCANRQTPARLASQIPTLRASFRKQLGTKAATTSTSESSAGEASSLPLGRPPKSWKTEGRRSTQGASGSVRSSAELTRFAAQHSDEYANSSPEVDQIGGKPKRMGRRPSSLKRVNRTAYRASSDAEVSRSARSSLDRQGQISRAISTSLREEPREKRASSELDSSELSEQRSSMGSGGEDRVGSSREALEPPLRHGLPLSVDAAEERRQPSTAHSAQHVEQGGRSTPVVSAAEEDVDHDEEEDVEERRRPPALSSEEDVEERRTDTHARGLVVEERLASEKRTLVSEKADQLTGKDQPLGIIEVRVHEEPTSKSQAVDEKEERRVAELEDAEQLEVRAVRQEAAAERLASADQKRGGAEDSRLSVEVRNSAELVLPPEERISESSTRLSLASVIGRVEEFSDPANSARSMEQRKIASDLEDTPRPSHQQGCSSDSESTELERRATDCSLYVMESLDVISHDSITERSEGEKRQDTVPMEAEPVPTSNARTGTARSPFTLNLPTASQGKPSSRRQRKKYSSSPRAKQLASPNVLEVTADEFDITEREAPAASLYEVLGETQSVSMVSDDDTWEETMDWQDDEEIRMITKMEIGQQDSLNTDRSLEGLPLMEGGEDSPNSSKNSRNYRGSLMMQTSHMELLRVFLEDDPALRRFYLNDTFKTLEISTDSLAKDVKQLMIQRLEYSIPQDGKDMLVRLWEHKYHLYVVNGTQERRLEPNDRVWLQEADSKVVFKYSPKLVTKGRASSSRAESPRGDFPSATHLPSDLEDGASDREREKGEQSPSSAVRFHPLVSTKKSSSFLRKLSAPKKGSRKQPHPTPFEESIVLVSGSPAPSSAEQSVASQSSGFVTEEDSSGHSSAAGRNTPDVTSGTRDKAAKGEKAKSGARKNKKYLNTFRKKKKKEPAAPIPAFHKSTSVYTIPAPATEALSPKAHTSRSTKKKSIDSLLPGILPTLEELSPSSSPRSSHSHERKREKRRKDRALSELTANSLQDNRLSKVRPLSELTSSPRGLTSGSLDEELALATPSSSRSADAETESTLEELQQNLAAFSSSMQDVEEAASLYVSSDPASARAGHVEDAIAKLHDQISVILNKVDGLSRQQSILESVALFSSRQLNDTDSPLSLLSSAGVGAATGTGTTTSSPSPSLRSSSASAGMPSESWTLWVLSLDNEEADEVPIPNVSPSSTIYSLKERIKSHPELCFADIPLSRLRLFNDTDVYLAPRSFVCDSLSDGGAVRVKITLTKVHRGRSSSRKSKTKSGSRRGTKGTDAESSHRRKRSSRISANRDARGSYSSGERKLATSDSEDSMGESSCY